jgi:DNA-binding transcriptional LysR family regulator
MTDASHVTLLPALLGHLREAVPQVAIEAARIDMDTGPALRDGRAALAMGLVPDLDAGFYQQALFVQVWVCLANPRHRSIASGTGYLLLERALMEQQITRRVGLELPGFLGLAAIVASTDLVATLPRHIGQTLARAGGLRLLGCPFPIPSFAVKLHWHARYHEEPGNRWLRGVCAHLFQQKMVNSAI